MNLLELLGGLPMITWLCASQLFWTFMLCRSHAMRDPAVSPALFEVIRAVCVLLAAVPAVYAVGWLLLPAWGLGAVPFGGR